MTSQHDHSQPAEQPQTRNLADAFDDELKPRERRFIGELILTDGNATRAAIRAGYPERSARQMAHSLLTRDDIRRALAERRALETASARDAVLSAEALIGVVSSRAGGDPRSVVQWHQEGRKIAMRAEDSANLTRAQALMVKGLKPLPDGRVEVILHDPAPSQRLLAEIHGLIRGDGADAGIKVVHDSAASLLAEDMDTMEIGPGQTLLIPDAGK